MAPPDRITSLARWRAGLALAAVVLPLALFAVFERQARRLDALAAQGAPMVAHVTGVSRRGGTTFYAYRVQGVAYTWSVARDKAPYAPGASFDATYLPSDPSLSRPFAERSLAAAESGRVRSFGWNAALGLTLFLGLFAILAHRDLRRLRAGAPPVSSEPAAVRRRLVLMSLPLLPALALITGFHVQDAREKGESVVPVVIGLVLTLGILGGALYFALRKGPALARTRAARLMRWLTPVAAGVALLKLLALAFSC